MCQQPNAQHYGLAECRQPKAKRANEKTNQTTIENWNIEWRTTAKETGRPRLRDCSLGKRQTNTTAATAIAPQLHSLLNRRTDHNTQCI